MGRKRTRQRKHVYLLVALIACILIVEGCAFFKRECREIKAVGDLREGEIFMSREDYAGALKHFKKVTDKKSQSADAALFYSGVIYASPKFTERDYQKSLDSFQRLTREFPQSRYRAEADRSVLLLREIVGREKRVKALKRQIESLEEQIESMKEVDLDVEEKRRKILDNK
jgi:tetratricopeptide (TPR) repeat protein